MNTRLQTQPLAGWHQERSVTVESDGPWLKESVSLATQSFCAESNLASMINKKLS